MTLKELQGMIKEELENYMGEEEVDVDVDMDAGDIDADGEAEGDTDEDVLRNIYDMLKAKFDGEEEAGDDMDDMDDMDEMDKDMDEEADLEEASSTGFGDAGSKKSSGNNAGYKTVGTLSEGAKRFQKLANIIK